MTPKMINGRKITNGCFQFAIRIGNQFESGGSDGLTLNQSKLTQLK